VSGVSFEEAILFLEEELRKEGFNVITEIDIKEAFRMKLNMHFRKYSIIGACNPAYTFRALHADDKAGVFLPLNFVIQQLDGEDIEISVVDPMAMMGASDNEDLNMVANQMQRKVRQIIEHLRYAEIHY
jgi:uncharacterized protein (DUF302 family)